VTAFGGVQNSKLKVQKGERGKGRVQGSKLKVQK
jgi:hypothetical protein